MEKIDTEEFDYLIQVAEEARKRIKQRAEIKADQQKKTYRRREFLKKAATVSLGLAAASTGFKAAQEHLSPQPETAFRNPLPSSKSVPIPEKAPASLPKEPASPSLKPETPATVKKEKSPDDQLLDQIASLPLGSQERDEQEEAYIQIILATKGKIETISKKKETDLTGQEKNQLLLSIHHLNYLLKRGFYVLWHPDLRAFLLDQRFYLRQKQYLALKSSTELGVITDGLIEYAKAKKIHPEVFAVCFFQRQKARRLLEKIQKREAENFWEYFRPDLVYECQAKNLTTERLNQIQPDDMLVNEGLMAELICTETGYTPQKGLLTSLIGRLKGSTRHLQSGFTYPDYRYGFCNIGSVPAKEQYQGDWYGKEGRGAKFLSQYLDILRKTTQIAYQDEHIPGSRAARGDSSGGAIGLQFMPDRLLEVNNFMVENFNLTFNVFDIDDSVMGAYLYLAMGQTIPTPQGMDYRYGYVKDLLQIIKNKFLDKWNRHLDQQKKIMEQSQSFEKEGLLVALKQ